MRKRPVRWALRVTVRTLDKVKLGELAEYVLKPD
jgi:hypothetical protein